MIYQYPSSPKPAYGVTTTQKHRTLISGTQSGGELRQRSIRFPKRNVGLLYNYLSLSDRNIIQNFFKDRDGSYEEFWYVDYKSKHWHDEYVGRGGPLNLIGAIQDDGGTFTSDTVACIKFITDGITPNEMHLLPAAPAHDDAYYFGAGSPFDLLTITIGTAGTPVYDPEVAGWTITWEYWNGTTWHAFAGGEFTDDTVGFTAAAGAKDFHINTMPTDWAITSVYNINAYWIRARVELFVTCTVRPLGSGAVVNSKYYDLHGVTTSEGKSVV